MKRNLSIDLLRTLIIIESIFLHLRSKMSLNIFDLVRYIPQNIFKVGTFFVLISGLMLYLVYFPRYQKDKHGMRIQLIKKGIIFLLIYFCYINILRLVHFEKIPLNLYDLFFTHPYMLKVIFTFSFIFLFAPLFLQLLAAINNINYILILPAFFIIISHLILNLVSLPKLLAISFFDALSVSYPVIPMLGVYSFGIWLGSIFNDYQKKPYHLVSVYLALLSFYYVGVNLFSITLFKLFLEISNLFIIIILLDFSFKRLNLNEDTKVLEFITLWGRRSLITYIGANFIIALLPDLKADTISVQLAVTCSIIIITYTLAWFYEYTLNKNALVNASK